MTEPTTGSTSEHHLPAGSTASGQYRTVVTPESAGWSYSGLRVLELPGGGGTTRIETGPAEALVLPLNGGCTVRCDGMVFELEGRENVFARVTDFAYLPRDASATVHSEYGGRFALPSARCDTRLTPRYVPSADVPVELRGAGQCSRQVNNFCTPQTFGADRLISCEVLTPGANWSSYPPHKHDEHTDTQRVLEEIYYFEVAPGPQGPGMAYQRVYGTPERPIDVLAEVRSEDVVLVPHGWHGPSMATPGYHLYYLNVMAGPEERAWLIRDDPAHGWIRQSWADQEIDPRLPLYTANGKVG